MDVFKASVKFPGLKRYLNLPDDVASNFAPDDVFNFKLEYGYAKSAIFYNGEMHYYETVFMELPMLTPDGYKLEFVHIGHIKPRVESPYINCILDFIESTMLDKEIPILE